MRVVPVIDLLAGQVVRGIAGRRAEYRPIVSRLVGDASPRSVGQAFIAQLGFRQCYVADLDAIAGGDPAWTVYAELMSLGLELWIDAGIGDVRRALALERYRSQSKALAGIVIGLESSPPPELLGELFAAVGFDRLIFSLDLKSGRPLTMQADWLGMSPEQIAATAVGHGARRLIVLDLAQVGTDAGVGTEALCGAIRKRHPQIELIAGGGVRDVQDLHRLAAVECDAALVASALHDGRITADDLKSLRSQV
jgi:phosphoribosylformimino-5-aminoimidazole carboxamide ribotide isomerase